MWRPAVEADFVYNNNDGNNGNNNGNIFFVQKCRVIGNVHKSRLPVRINASKEVRHQK